jgi:DNA topoisomerase IB
MKATSVALSEERRRLRRRRGRGFEYMDERGDRVERTDVIERLNELAIPPAWKDVGRA